MGFKYKTINDEVSIETVCALISLHVYAGYAMSSPAQSISIKY